MDVKARLTEEVDGVLNRILSLPWSVHANAIRGRYPSPAGDTFGFGEDGVMFDVGDSAEWLGEPEGDILLKAFVTAYLNPNDENGITEERSAICKRPEAQPSKELGVPIAPSAILVSLISALIRLFTRR